MNFRDFKFWKTLILCIVGCAIHQPVSASELQHSQPSAPMVVCTIRMNFWCIVRADASLSMSESGDYRIWRMAQADGKKSVVTIHENKSCDSPADLKPRVTSEKNVQLASGERHRVTEIAMTSDGVCNLKIDYLTGDTDLAREATQMAKYRLYSCSDGSCRKPLLEIGKPGRR